MVEVLENGFPFRAVTYEYVQTDAFVLIAHQLPPSLSPSPPYPNIPFRLFVLKELLTYLRCVL